MNNVRIVITETSFRIGYNNKEFLLMQSISRDKNDPVLEVIAEKLGCSVLDILNVIDTFPRFFVDK